MSGSQNDVRSLKVRIHSDILTFNRIKVQTSAPSVQCECRDSCVESLLPKVGLELDLCNGSRSLEKLVDRSDRQEEDQGLWQVF